MKRQQKKKKNVKEGLQEMQGRKHKENPKWQKCDQNFKVLQEMKMLRQMIKFVKNQGQEQHILIQIMKCQGFCHVCCS